MILISEKNVLTFYEFFFSVTGNSSRDMRLADCFLHVLDSLLNRGRVSNMMNSSYSFGVSFRSVREAFELFGGGSDLEALKPFGGRAE